MAKWKGDQHGPHVEPPWWTPRCPWPPSVRFEDGPTEGVIDRTMPLPELPVGTYVSAGGLCLEARFAEPEVEGVSS
jgi:hypothetical protein